jgi:hypothetical protein
MTLRFLLVGAVAALGFDLPQGIDVDAWSHSGRAWWHARVAEFEARHGIALAEVEDHSSPVEPVVEVEAPAPDDDAIFATVIEDVVSAFSADEVLVRTKDAEDSSQLVAGVDDASYGPEFADALNRWADGLSEPAEPATLASQASERSTDPEVDSIEVPISGFAGSAFASEIVLDEQVPALATSMVDSSTLEDGEGQGSSLSDSSEGPGIARAVQLTGQAFQAWLALVQTTSPTVNSAL